MNERIAVISDVHSNYIALDAVLKDIREKGVEEVFCLGDLTGYAPSPDKVFPLLEGIKTVMGNYDDAVAFEREECGCHHIDPEAIRLSKISLEWTIGHTSKVNKEWMKDLPKELRMEFDGRRVVMIHGHQGNIGERIQPNSPDDLFLETMDKYDADILFCAHSHIFFHRILGERHFINPGSVGRPRTGDPRASYAIVDFGKDVRVDFRLVEYDHEGFAREIEDSDMAENNFADVIRAGHWKM